MIRRLGSYWILPAVIILLYSVYLNWFTPGILASGDWVYYFPETIRGFDWLPLWDIRHNGLGQSHLSILWLDAYFVPTAKLSALLGLSWEAYERVFWFFPFLIVGLTSVYLLYRPLFPKDRLGRFVSPVLYLTNTYILMVVSGGQMGVSMAYVLFPLAFLTVIRLLRCVSEGNNTLFMPLIQTIGVTSLLFMFDIRFGILLLGLAFLYAAFMHTRDLKKNLKTFVKYALFTGFGIALLHMYWLFPLIFFRLQPSELSDVAYSALDMVKFLSIGDLSHAIAWLHPNWPENIFGKTYFLQSEFLLLPVIVFGSLLFIKNRMYAFFTFTALIGAFLTKGTNGELGGIYAVLYTYAPGFVLFRDATKFLTIVSLSYSLMLPYAAVSICSRFFKKRNEEQSHAILLTVFLLVWSVLIRDAIWGKIGGALSGHTIPESYIKTKEYLSSDEQFGRVLWFPQKHRFSFYSDTHPAVSGLIFANVASESSLLSYLEQTTAGEELSRASVSYIVVSEDTDNQFFLEDRKYNPYLQAQAVQRLQAISWLTYNQQYGNIHIFKTKHHYPLVYIKSDKTEIQSVEYMQESQTRFILSVPNVRAGDTLVFSQTHDPGWRLTAEKQSIVPGKSSYGYNEFVLSENENQFVLEYVPQKGVVAGSVISFATVLFLGGVYVHKRSEETKKKKKHTD